MLGRLSLLAPLWCAACTLLPIGESSAPATAATEVAPSEPRRPPPANQVVALPPAGPAVDAPESPAIPKAADGPSRPLDVLLVIVDGMRIDMPWAGYERDIAPNLTALEKHSVSYTRGYSVSSYTAKSVAAMLSGQYPSALVRSGHFFTVFPESNLFFPEVLQKGGVHTMSAQAGTYLRHGTGLDQGFVDWRIIQGVTMDPRSKDFITSEKLTRLVIEQLRAAPVGRPRFLYVHYMDPHEPYLKHPEAPQWGNSARDRYDQEIFHTDRWVGQLIDFCRRQGWWDRTAVIVTADHGEGFGEHGRFKHAFDLWEMLTRVPLFFRLPGASPRRIGVPRSHIDLAPTILDLMGQPIPAEFAGKSLVPELYGGEAYPRPVLLDLPEDNRNPERRALVDGDWKLMVYGPDDAFDLYDLRSDPGEEHKLTKKEPEKLEQMKSLYQRLWGAVHTVQAYGGVKLVSGNIAKGPSR